VHGPALVADAIVQRGRAQAERAGRVPHRVEPDAAQEDVRGEVVADGADQRGEVAGGQRLDGEVLPEAGVGDRVLRRARERLVRVEAARGLDQQQQLADARARQDAVAIGRREHDAGRGVADAHAPLDAGRQRHAEHARHPRDGTVPRP